MVINFVSVHRGLKLVLDHRSSVLKMRQQPFLVELVALVMTWSLQRRSPDWVDYGSAHLRVLVLAEVIGLWLCNVTLVHAHHGILRFVLI